MHYLETTGFCLVLGQFPPGSGGSKGYGGSLWGPGGQGQGDPYTMAQRSGGMPGGPMGSGYPPMGMSPDQQLRLRQEQLMQAQQARRMQQQQQQQQAGGGGMYPTPPPGPGGQAPPTAASMMPPLPPQGQPGLPPSYPPPGAPNSMNPHAMPPGTRPMKMH